MDLTQDESEQEEEEIDAEVNCLQQLSKSLQNIFLTLKFYLTRHCQRRF